MRQTILNATLLLPYRLLNNKPLQMEKVNMHRIFFFVIAAVGASFLSGILLQLAGFWGPRQPVGTGIGLGVVLAAIVEFYRWFFTRQFGRVASKSVYLFVIVGVAIVAAFAFVANWHERMAWVIAVIVLIIWWLVQNFVLPRSKK